MYIQEKTHTPFLAKGIIVQVLPLFMCFQGDSNLPPEICFLQFCLALGVRVGRSVWVRVRVSVRFRVWVRVRVRASVRVSVRVGFESKAELQETDFRR